jgi:hypothetical protein
MKNNTIVDALIANLLNSFKAKGWKYENNLPEFIYNREIKFHTSRKTLTVIFDDNELLDKNNSDFPLLGVYKIFSNEKPGVFVLFEETIKRKAERYANEQSIVVANGKTIGDLRNTMGNAMSGTPAGILESDAIEYVSTISKIYLTCFWIVHWMKDSKDEQWLDRFYYEVDEKNYIDNLAYWLTLETITENEKLLECFKYLNIIQPSININCNTDIEKIIQILRNIKTKASLKDKICLFDLFEGDINKINNQKEVSDSEQSRLVAMAKDELIKWNIVIHYINKERKEENIVKITAENMGI